MKQLYFLFAFFLLFSSCQQTYEYEGEYPDLEYLSIANTNIEQLNTTNLLSRNRIYISIDTVKGILLNNHAVSNAKFDKAFHFVFNNPKQLEHLPQKWTDAIILLDLTQILGRFDAPMETERNLLSEVMNTAFLKNIFPNQAGNIPLEVKSLTEKQRLELEKYIGKQVAFADLEIQEADKGIRVKRPPWSDIPSSYELKERNVFEVLVNDKNELIVEGELAKIEDLKDRAKAFISNPDNNPTLAESPKQAIISLKNDRGTDYKTYIAVYNELKAAYTELWEEAAQVEYGLSYEELENEQKKKIRVAIPLVISEAESDFGE